jgi:GDP-4-dehydro-6-deoxy-D-mannose reductase
LTVVRALVTGGRGFVGRWLCSHLEDTGDEVVATGHDVDVVDAGAVRRVVTEAAPDAVYHLAGLTHVGDSWGAPAETFRVNVLGTVHVLDAARACPVPPRVLVVSSAEVYGAVRPEELPVTEETPLRPITPYAGSKAAAEYAALQVHLGYGLHAVRVRAFNHAGPGQSPSFVVSALARRIAEAERVGARSVRVGNLDARRDLTDVRDVVRAYRLVVERGEAGAVYNVCSGRAVAVGELARRLLRLSHGELELEPDPELVRPVEVPVLLGDPSRVTTVTGWTPEIPLDETLAAVLEEWRARV